jgi:hypothetical protein
MPTQASSPIPNGPGDYTWRGSASVISYQVRFYAGSQGLIDKPGGDATRSISVLQPWDYDVDGGDTSRVIESTLENTPSATVTAGEWIILGLGLGETQVKFTISAVTPAVDSTHYRILVKS